MAGSERFLRNQRVRLAMPQISWGCPDSLGDLMGMLNLRAVHFNHGPRVPKQNLSGGLNDTCLSRARRPQQQEIPHRAAWRVQAGAENLIQVHQRLDTFILSNNFRAQRPLKVDRIRAALAGIEGKDVVTHDRLLASPACEFALPNCPPPRSN